MSQQLPINLDNLDDHSQQVVALALLISPVLGGKPFDVAIGATMFWLGAMCDQLGDPKIDTWVAERLRKFADTLDGFATPTSTE